MIKNWALFLTAVALMALTLAESPRLWAGDLEWSGLYRVEGLSLNDPALSSGIGKRKEYGVHTLILRPKIVAADGLYINAQLNIFNSAEGDGANQLGSYFGAGLGTTPSTDSNNSNTYSENEKSEDLKVTQFYLTQTQENGSLIVGRAPIQFGLGMTHSAGRGLFDHYSDTLDLVGYKMMMGNFYLFPMYGKVSEGTLSGYDDVSELDFQLQYDNPENDVSMGVFYQNRKGSEGGNDSPGGPLGSNPATAPFTTKNFNVFYKKDTEDYSIGFEVAQQSGDTGVTSVAANQNISISGFGIATEFEYHPKESKTAWGLKAGMATGDDPKTTDEYEGFIFDRNYDVAMLLFNHGLGQADVLHTALIGRKELSTAGNASTVNGKPDTEAVSNVTYFSPYYKHKWSDKWSMVGALTVAWLNNTSVFVDANADNIVDPGELKSADVDLGYELDLSLHYNVSEKITWVNEFGYLMPGKAWEAGTQGFDTSTMYGFLTKAAVSF